MDKNRDLLYRFFNRTATLEEEVEFRKWLEASDKNRQEYFRERKLFDVIILQGNVEKGERKKLNIIPWKKALIAVSGIAAVVLITTMITVDYVKQSFRNEKMNTVIVPQGQRVNLILSDGTNVWLNAKSRLEYPQSFLAAEQRTVKIDGEAYFEVTKNPKKPFVVETSKGTIEVLGTKFLVNAYTSSDKFETALIEGSVNVRTSGGRMILAPNDKAVLVNGKMVRQKIEDMDTYRWREGLFCFKDMTFDEVLKRFEVYYDVRFVKENNRMANPKITSKFRLVDGIDYALRVLQREIKFTYQRDKEANVIYLK